MLDGGAGRGRTLYDDGTEGVGDAGLEGELASFFELDHVEQRAEDAWPAGEMLDAGTCVRFVKGHL